MTGYWEAFWTLSRSRQMGFGAAGRIPVGEIFKWIEHYGLKGEAAEDLLHYVAVLDDEYLAAMSESRSPTTDETPKQE